ncbi:hypothetical protein JCM19239_5817 [Vibrio variabilis]|uniref:Uncharacterized protein n=1 Tax=Vibrio variabilis TaxID=990271 RepID=A0ABQ0J897_9VIBR|nr:hypothetical protein JCM19239_5817 [Vibrio variabilis]
MAKAKAVLDAGSELEPATIALTTYFTAMSVERDSANALIEWLVKDKLGVTHAERH